MKKNTANLMKVLNIVCALLMLALLICQFVPFWNLEGQEISIGGYIWFPTDHGDLTAYFQESLNNSDFSAGSLVLVNVLIILSSVAGVIFCVRNAGDIWPAIFPAVCGLSGIYGYIAKPAFRLGAMWPLHLVLSVVMLALSVGSLVCGIKRNPENE